jgi:hypothetical protein
MKKLILFFALFVCVTVLAFAQDISHVTAEGVASVGTDAAAAHDKALEDALRRAVEQAVGTIVESETATENYQLLTDKIYSHSSGYVKSYKILSESQDGGLTRIKISADVSSGDLSDDLASIGLLQRRMKYPRVVVMISETNVFEGNWWNMYTVSNNQAESTVIEKLKAKGFNVVDPGSVRKGLSSSDAMQAWQGNDMTAGRIGSKFSAEVVVVGAASSTQADNTIAGSDLISVSTTLNARAVKTGSGEILAQASADGTAAHINNVVALQQAMQKASEKVADNLIGGILEAWKQESSGSRNLVVVVDGISPAELDKLKAAFLNARGVVDVVVRNFSSGTAEMNIQAKSDAQDLADIMAKKSYPGFHLVLQESSADRLEYRVVH